MGVDWSLPIVVNYAGFLGFAERLVADGWEVGGGRFSDTPLF